MKNYRKFLVITISLLGAGTIGLTVWNNLPKKTPEQKILEEFDSQRSVTLGSKKIIVPENWSLLEAVPGETENSVSVTLIPTQKGSTLTTSPAGVTLTLEKLPPGTPTDQENLQKFAIASVEDSLPEKAQVLKSPRISEKNSNTAETTFIYTTGKPSSDTKETTWACAIYSIVSPSSQITAVFGVNQTNAPQYSQDLQAIRKSLGL